MRIALNCPKDCDQSGQPFTFVTCGSYPLCLNKAHLFLFVSVNGWVITDLGYSWTGKVSEPWCSFLPGCWLLCSCVWCQLHEIIWQSQQLERRVSDPGTHSSSFSPLTIDKALTRCHLQASPSDPENFPFVLIGNKVDVDGGNSRVVWCALLISPLWDECLWDVTSMLTDFNNRFQRRRLKLGVLRRETFPTLRPLLRKAPMWRKLSNALPRTRWRAEKRKSCKFHYKSDSMHTYIRVWSQRFVFCFSL